MFSPILTMPRNNKILCCLLYIYSSLYKKNTRHVHVYFPLFCFNYFYFMQKLTRIKSTRPCIINCVLMTIKRSALTCIKQLIKFQYFFKNKQNFKKGDFQYCQNHVISTPILFKRFLLGFIGGDHGREFFSYGLYGFYTSWIFFSWFKMVNFSYNT